MQSDFAKLAHLALKSSDFLAFENALATHALPESFGVLADGDVVQLMNAQMEDGVPADWITRPLTWDVGCYSPVTDFNPSEKLLHLLWQDLSTRLIRKLSAVVRHTAISPEGAIFCFFGRAEFSLLVEYRTTMGGSVKLQPLMARHVPNGILELSTLLEEAPPRLRNTIKNVVLSADKIVFQRGTIVHVNRHTEKVFGPSVDTVILAELIAEHLERNTFDRPLSALEVGSGSGLLSAILATSDHVRDLTTIDVNPSAVTCTLKNLLVNDISLDATHQCVRVRAERFSVDQLTNRFDIIVCNPPYLPDSPEPIGPQLKEYGRAIGALGGYDLCIALIEKLDKLLAKDGVLLLMTSSVSDTEILTHMPRLFEATPALPDGGRRVPLDVDLLWDTPSLRDTLLEKQRLEVDENNILWHRICPLWINRKGEH